MLYLRSFKKLLATIISFEYIFEKSHDFHFNLKRVSVWNEHIKSPLPFVTIKKLLILLTLYNSFHVNCKFSVLCFEVVVIIYNPI